MREVLVLAAVAALVLGVPAARAQTADPEPEIRKQPTDVERPNVVEIEWAGGEAHIFIERTHGDEWISESDDEASDAGVDPTEEENVWVGRWQSNYSTPSGTYRIRINGEGYELISDEFKVRRCQCIFPNPVRARWRKGRYLITETAKYATPPPDGFIELPTRVTTGRPLVRVFRDARAVGKVRLRYRRGRFRGKWRGPKGPPDSRVFQLISQKDRWGNR